MKKYVVLSIALLCSVSAVVYAGQKRISNKLDQPIIILLKGEKDDKPQAGYIPSGGTIKVKYKGRSALKFDSFGYDNKKNLITVETDLKDSTEKCNKWLNTKDSFVIKEEFGVIKGVAFNHKEKKYQEVYVKRSGDDFCM